MSTLFIKMTDKSQYDTKRKQITYTDSTPSRWAYAYGKVKANDNGVFHCSDQKLLIGKFAYSNTNASITFDQVLEVSIKLDDFLRIDLIEPETLAHFKRPSGPTFKENMNLDIASLISAVTQKDFISFFIVKESDIERLKPKLKNRDRVVILDEHNTIKRLDSFGQGKLEFMTFENELFNSKDKTLTDLLALHEQLKIKKKSKNSNNVICLEKIINTLQHDFYYEFSSFSEYYNIIHNKRAYLNTLPHEEAKDKNVQKSTTNQNTILYGPPGTGKTYLTIEKAISIADPDYVFPSVPSSEQGRKDVKTRYQKLVDIGQIAFTTFHQSLSYEDFVEGLKPSSSNGDIAYDIEPGIFKSFCSKASAVKTSNFTEAYNALITYISSLDDPHYKILTKTKTPFYVSVNQNGNLNLFTTEYKNKQGAITKENLELFSLSEKPFIGWEGYVYGIITHLKEQFGLDVVSESKKKNYVLIIDEINRGNVSQIFGELITLIEEDKRLGNPEALEVILPYSKQKFGVPPNLYIIGTMNTADRSVEALDTALRRRFSFEFVGPDSSLVPEYAGEIKLRELFETINVRISYLLDEDHQIGHSYFMEVKSIRDLMQVFENKLIPLLKEYFYNDYGKIRLVLGDGFVHKSEINKVSFAAEDNDLFTDKVMFEFKSISNEDDFKQAIEQTLSNV